MKETMTIELTRHEVCQLMLACTGIAIDHDNEAGKEETTETRKQVCEETSKMWRALREVLKTQLDEYDQFQEWKANRCNG